MGGGFRRLLESSAGAARRAFAWRLEDFGPPSEKLLVDFARADHRALWHVLSDTRYGGTSTATLDTVECSGLSSSSSSSSSMSTGVNGLGDISHGNAVEARCDAHGGGAVPQVSRDPPNSFVSFRGVISLAVAQRPVASAAEAAAASPSSSSSSSSGGSSNESSSQSGGSSSNNSGGSGGWNELLMRIAAGNDGSGSGKLRRSGFAYMRTTEGDTAACFDLEPFDSLVFEARGDGRHYISTIRTDNWVGGPGEAGENTWQAILRLPSAGQWHTVEIPLSRYVKTWKGKVLPSKSAMNAGRVVGLGIAVSVGEAAPQTAADPTAPAAPAAAAAAVGRHVAPVGEGPFQLDIATIRAVRKT